MADLGADPNHPVTDPNAPPDAVQQGVNPFTGEPVFATPGGQVIDEQGNLIDPTNGQPIILRQDPGIPWWEQLGIPAPAPPIQQSIADLIGEADQQLTIYGGYANFTGPDTGSSTTYTTTPQPGPTPAPAPTPTPPYNVPPTLKLPNPSYNPPKGVGHYQQPFPPYQITEIQIDPAKQFIPNPFGPGSVPNPYYNPSAPPPTVTIPNPAYKPPAPAPPAPAPAPSVSTSVTVNNVIGKGLDAMLRQIADAVLAAGGEISHELSASTAQADGVLGAGLSAVAAGLHDMASGVSQQLSAAFHAVVDGLSAMLDKLEAALAGLLRLLWDELLAVLRSMGKFFWDEFEGRFIEDVPDPLAAK